MLTLTRASVVSRKGIRYFIYIVGGILFLRFTILSGIDIYEKLKTDPPDKPNVKFGQLPELPFPKKENIPDDLNYTLETVTGSLPKFSEQATVYLMPRPLSSINALQKARSTAGALGFSSNPRELVETVYQFSKANSPSSLSMNIVTGSFSISFNVNSNPQILDSLPPSAQAAKAKAKDLLDNAELTKDIFGPTTHQFLRIESGKLVEAISQSEANLTKVNLYRKNYGPEGNKFPSITPDPFESNVWFLMGGSESQIIAGEYHHFPVDQETNATYPLKTPQKAWEDLKSGKGYIANFGDNENGNIIIRNISIAYYDAGHYVEFYQPIVVFKGDNDFVAYVPAVTDEFYGSTEGSNEN